MIPTVGKIVHYKLGRGRSKGEVRSAEIVRVWSDTVVNLHIKLDGDNDDGFAHPEALGKAPLFAWEISVKRGEDEGQWFWPPRV